MDSNFFFKQHGGKAVSIRTVLLPVTAVNCVKKGYFFYRLPLTTVFLKFTVIALFSLPISHASKVIPLFSFNAPILEIL